jgi:hypothetical protein
MLCLTQESFDEYDSSSFSVYQFVIEGILYLLILHYNQYLMHIAVNYLLQIILYLFYPDQFPKLWVIPALGGGGPVGWLKLFV